MFNFKNVFRNQNVDDIIDDIKERGGYTVDIPQVQVPETVDNSACYMIGTTSDGCQTQLRVGRGDSMTLTLSPASVAIMIKQLAATIDHAYDVKVKELPND